MKLTNVKKLRVSVGICYHYRATSVCTQANALHLTGTSRSCSVYSLGSMENRGLRSSVKESDEQSRCLRICWLQS